MAVEFGKILSPQMPNVTHHDYSSSDDNDDYAVLNDSSISNDGWGTEREQREKRADKVRPLFINFFHF